MGRFHFKPLYGMLRDTPSLCTCPSMRICRLRSSLGRDPSLNRYRLVYGVRGVKTRPLRWSSSIDVFSGVCAFRSVTRINVFSEDKVCCTTVKVTFCEFLRPILGKFPWRLECILHWRGPGLDFWSVLSHSTLKSPPLRRPFAVRVEAPK